MGCVFFEVRTECLDIMKTSFLVKGLMEAARTSEASVNFYQTTRSYNPEDFILAAVRTSNSIKVIKVF
jgi:hypothetical protein